MLTNQARDLDLEARAGGIPGLLLTLGKGLLTGGGLSLLTNALSGGSKECVRPLFLANIFLTSLPSQSKSARSSDIDIDALHALFK